MNIYSVTILIAGLLFGMIQPTVSTVTASSTTPLPAITVTPATMTSPATMSTSPATTSTYSNSLQRTSPTFARPNGSVGNYYYYQAIQVTTYTSATYTFTSSSSIDTYGCFYQGSFDPYNPSRNLLACDDDSGGNYQFRISSTLQSSGIYILVVTTFNVGDTGSYSVIAGGPAPVYMTSITPSTPRPTSAPSVTTTYSSSLQSTSPTFVRPNGNLVNNYYYEAIQVTTYTTGTYQFRSSSSIDTYGCFYQGSFNPYYPSGNLIACDDDSAGDRQFLISVGLLYGQTYILVVTTFSAGVTGSYSITAAGPATITMNSLTPVIPTFSGTLSSSSPTFSRPYGSGSSYYFQAIQIKTGTTGTYTLTSRSAMDTYGCLYTGSFDASNPWQNLIAYDDDTGGSLQFLISRYLQSGSTYILVVTTSSSRTTGSYVVTAGGSGSVNMTAIASPGSNPLNTVQIVAITCGCLVVFIIILTLFVWGCKRQTASNQRIISRRASPSPHAHHVYLPGAQGNRAQGYGVGMPNTSPIYTASVPCAENHPPSYETFMSAAKPYQQ